MSGTFNDDLVMGCPGSLHYSAPVRKYFVSFAPYLTVIIQEALLREKCIGPALDVWSFGSDALCDCRGAIPVMRNYKSSDLQEYPHSDLDFSTRRALT